MNTTKLLSLFLATSSVSTTGLLRAKKGFFGSVSSVAQPTEEDYWNQFTKVWFLRDELLDKHERKFGGVDLTIPLITPIYIIDNTFEEKFEKFKESCEKYASTKNMVVNNKNFTTIKKWCSIDKHIDDELRRIARFEMTTKCKIFLIDPSASSSASSSDVSSLLSNPPAKGWFVAFAEEKATGDDKRKTTLIRANLQKLLNELNDCKSTNKSTNKSWSIKAVEWKNDEAWKKADKSTSYISYQFPWSKSPITTQSIYEK